MPKQSPSPEAKQANALFLELQDQLTQLTTFFSRPKHTIKEKATFKKFAEAAQELMALPNYQTLHQKATKDHHCVRCHETFSDATNGPKACIIPHKFDRDNGDAEYSPHTRLHGGFEEYKTYFWSECCELKVVASGDDDPVPPKSFCFQGEHTTNPKKVQINGVLV